MQSEMRKIVIAGTYAQYRDYLNLAHANPKAALHIHKGEQLAHFDPDIDEIVLVGTYRDNEAYQSPEYWDFIGSQNPVQIAI